MSPRAAPLPASEAGAVESADGTTIGYRTLGRGPGVLLVHGAGQFSGNLLRLAGALADRFTVSVPDRRGRGASGPAEERHGLGAEVEDLGALLDATGARFVFGLSAGAVIAIETARVRLDIEKVALYEPPLSFDGVVHGAWVPRYERELAAGRPGGALAAALKGTADRTSLVRLVPSALLAAPLNFLVRRASDGAVPSGMMAPGDIVRTLRYDARTVREAAGPLERFSGLRCRVLLLGGSRSAPNLTRSLDGLSAVLPDARRVVLGGVGHTAPDNARQPDRVAAELVRFFAD